MRIWRGQQTTLDTRKFTLGSEAGENKAEENTLKFRDQ